LAVKWDFVQCAGAVLMRDRGSRYTGVMRAKAFWIGIGSALILAACSIAPWRRPPEVPPAQADTAEAQAKQCHDLKAQIAWYQKQRNAPPLTTSPQIAAAAEAKNDDRIQTLRQRYEDAGCEEGG
jgi:hypothetical protein